ncbi:hypothetical protein SB717_39300, partial [Priestia sp. SIMBA_032]|uniref:hypothetical protein n=1 Tax=Priestia sp. SIMBA_032 TaxID=3085775 RepID=UPI003978CF01
TLDVHPKLLISKPDNRLIRLGPPVESRRKAPTPMSLPARVALRLAIVLALVLIAGALFTVAAFFTARAVYEPQLPPVEA